MLDDYEIQWENIFILIIILAVGVSIALAFDRLLTYKSSSVTLSSDVLDDTCKHLLNDESAIFYREGRTQKNFLCQADNLIIILNKEQVYSKFR